MASKKFEKVMPSKYPSLVSKKVYGMYFQLDAWDMEDIEQNLAEYVNSAIVRADKVGFCLLAV